MLVYRLETLLNRRHRLQAEPQAVLKCLVENVQDFCSPAAEAGLPDTLTRKLQPGMHLGKQALHQLLTHDDRA